ncbi:unnamed protein product [Cuscuta epithymum]|uniref:Uncharacterized protein n=1 Tax=Cuscuta epithymum TaxID=186058 RepID=A0AAV0FJ73_9ASTE|nr:unnamed protein product [Cuscuta epithymum]
MEGRRMATRNNPRGQAPVASQRGSRAASRGSRGGRGGRGSRGGHQAQTVEARACYLHLLKGGIKSGRRGSCFLIFFQTTAHLLMDVYFTINYFWGLHAHVIGRLWLMTYR